MRFLFLAAALLVPSRARAADATTTRLGGLTVPQVGSYSWGTKLNGDLFQISTKAASQVDTNTFNSSNTFKAPLLASNTSFTLTGPNGFITSASSVTANYLTGTAGGVYAGQVTILGSSLTVAGNAFSVGTSTLSVSQGTTTINQVIVSTVGSAFGVTVSSGITMLRGTLKLGSGTSITWGDGTVSTTTASGGTGATVGANNAFTGNNTHSGLETFSSTITVGTPIANVFTTTISYASVIKAGRTEVAIATFTSIGSIMFTGFNSSYTHHIEIRLTQNTSNAGVYLRYNGSTGTGYRWDTHRSVSDNTSESEGSESDTECQITGTSLIRATDNFSADLTINKVIPSFGDKTNLVGIGRFILSTNNETNFRDSCLYEPSGAALNTISVTLFPSAGTWTGLVRVLVDIPGVSF